jgi:uncharacterized protein YtpQ (UPF0354 family)
MFDLFKKKRAASEPDSSTIVPRIKHTNFLIALRDIVKKQDDMPVTEPLVGDLLVTYAFDLPEMFQMFCARDRQRLGLTLEQLRAVAVGNLRKQVPKIGRKGEPPLLQVVVGNDLEACVLLLDEFWPSIADKIPPEIVVGVPSRNVLLVTSSASTKGGLQLLRQAVNEAHGRETTHALTLDLLVRRGDKWERFDG